jgi:hypothetical protein
VSSKSLGKQSRHSNPADLFEPAKPLSRIYPEKSISFCGVRIDFQTVPCYHEKFLRNCACSSNYRFTKLRVGEERSETSGISTTMNVVPWQEREIIALLDERMFL